MKQLRREHSYLPGQKSFETLCLWAFIGIRARGVERFDWSASDDPYVLSQQTKNSNAECGNGNQRCAVFDIPLLSYYKLESTDGCLAFNSKLSCQQKRNYVFWSCEAEGDVPTQPK